MQSLKLFTNTQISLCVKLFRMSLVVWDWGMVGHVDMFVYVLSDDSSCNVTFKLMLVT